jgi:hypothetical protein
LNQEKIVKNNENLFTPTTIETNTQITKQKDQPSITNNIQTEEIAF